MSENRKFTLCEEHLTLLARLSYTYSFFDPCAYENDIVLPDFDNKRLFGNTTSWMEVAELLGMEPVRQYTHRELLEGKDETDGFPGGYDPAQRMTCLLRIVELPVAMSVIFQYKTFEPGTYEMDRGIAARYYRARNYTYLLPVIRHIEELSGGSNYHLHDLAANACFDAEESPYTQLLRSLSVSGEGLEPMPEWRDIARRELVRCSAAVWSPLTGRVPTLTEAPM